MLPRNLPPNIVPTSRTLFNEVPFSHSSASWGRRRSRFSLHEAPLEAALWGHGAEPTLGNVLSTAWRMVKERIEEGSSFSQPELGLVKQISAVVEPVAEAAVQGLGAVPTLRPSSSARVVSPRQRRVSTFLSRTVARPKTDASKSLQFAEVHGGALETAASLSRIVASELEKDFSPVERVIEETMRVAQCRVWVVDGSMPSVAVWRRTRLNYRSDEASVAGLCLRRGCTVSSGGIVRGLEPSDRLCDADLSASAILASPIYLAEDLVGTVELRSTNLSSSFDRKEVAAVEALARVLPVLLLHHTLLLIAKESFSKHSDSQRSTSLRGPLAEEVIRFLRQGMSGSE